jgi:hypothetical protein
MNLFVRPTLTIADNFRHPATLNSGSSRAGRTDIGRSATPHPPLYPRGYTENLESWMKTMSRNFYILAGTLMLFALISAGMALVPSSFQPGLPANGSLWRTVALVLLLAGLASALVGV